MKIIIIIIIYKNQFYIYKHKMGIIIHIIQLIIIKTNNK